MIHSVVRDSHMIALENVNAAAAIVIDDVVLNYCPALVCLTVCLGVTQVVNDYTITVSVEIAIGRNIGIFVDDVAIYDGFHAGIAVNVSAFPHAYAASGVEGGVRCVPSNDVMADYDVVGTCCTNATSARVVDTVP